MTGSGPAEIQFREVDERSEPTGIDHVAIAADDVDETVELAVREFDVTVEREPRTLERVGERLVVITDPEGYTIHLLESVD